MPIKDKTKRLEYQRKFYADHREDQCAKILANRARRKKQEKANRAAFPYWDTYADYMKFCRKVGAKPKSYIDWQAGRGLCATPTAALNLRRRGNPARISGLPTG